MKFIKYFLCTLAFVAVVGVSAPLQAKTHISLNLGGFFSFFAPPARTVIVHPRPQPYYEEIHVYPHGYREHHIYHPTPRPPTRRVCHYRSCSNPRVGVSYSRTTGSY
jgi:hypothetical protein